MLVVVQLFVEPLKPSEIRVPEEFPRAIEEVRFRVEPVQIGFGVALAIIAPVITVIVIDFELVHP